MVIRFFLDPVQVLSIGRNPIYVLLIRSDPVRSGQGFVNPIQSDPVQILLTPIENKEAECMRENVRPAVPISSNQVYSSANVAEFTSMPSSKYSMATK